MDHTLAKMYSVYGWITYANKFRAPTKVYLGYVWHTSEGWQAVRESTETNRMWMGVYERKDDAIAAVRGGYAAKNPHQIG